MSITICSHPLSPFTVPSPFSSSSSHPFSSLLISFSSHPSGCLLFSDRLRMCHTRLVTLLLEGNLIGDLGKQSLRNYLLRNSCHSCWTCPSNHHPPHLNHPPIPPSHPCLCLQASPLPLVSSCLYLAPSSSNLHPAPSPHPFDHSPFLLSLSSPLNPSPSIPRYPCPPTHTYPTQAVACCWSPS